jgi:biopolymer transport protein ExbD
MNNKFLWIILLVVAIFSVSAYLYNKDKQKTLDESRAQAINNEIQRPSITINAKHQFKNGQHVFVASIELPNPCNKITTEVTKDPNETIINVNYASTSQVCTEVITEKEFKVSFEGTADENIIAKLNGELVNLNLFEITSDQNIDEVKIYNKG